MSLTVVPLPVNNLNDISGMARRFADAVDAGEHGEVTTVFVILESSEGFECFGWGAADDPLRNIGLLAIAKRQQIDLATD